jgi:hypothetical protein
MKYLIHALLVSALGASSSCTVPTVMTSDGPVPITELARADYGPEPILDVLVPEAERRIRATLELPDSALFRWSECWEACWWEEKELAESGMLVIVDHHFAWRISVRVRSKTANAGYTKERRSWVYCRGDTILWMTLPKEKPRFVHVSPPDGFTVTADREP